MLSGHREVVIDTETTGLDPYKGHRIVEIAAVEIVGRVRTGNHFHAYVNPDRDMPIEAFQIHGISADFLQDKPPFAEVAKEFLDFVGTSTMIIHNAPFDIGFINHELATLGINPLTMSRVTDTLTMARKKFPGAPASLDALCKRFNISLSARGKHGALVDSELLALVYAELMGGSQRKFDLRHSTIAADEGSQKPFPRRQVVINELDHAKHSEMMKKICNSLWNKHS